MKNFGNMIIATALLITAPALAQHQGHQMPAAKPSADHTMSCMKSKSSMDCMKSESAMPMNEASKAYAEANAKMHKKMVMVFSGNADLDFAKGMTPHHQGAIDMANIVLKFGRDAAVKKMAQDIIKAQKAEIAQMATWIAKNSSQPATPDAVGAAKAFTEVNARMHADMTMSFTGNADIDFMKGMIPHHEGAVAMAKVLLQFGKDAALRKLADDVVRTQNEEITMMRDWLKKSGA